MAQILPRELTPIPGGTINPAAAFIVDNLDGVYQGTAANIVDAGAPINSQGEAEAGLINTGRMTPLRVAQALAALGVSQDVLASSIGAGMVGFLQPETDAELDEVTRKLREAAVSLLDFVPSSVRVNASGGTAAVDSYFAKMVASGAAAGFIPKGSFKLNAQASITSAGFTLLLDPGSELFSTDSSIESLILVEEDDVRIVGSPNARLRMPLSNTTGLTGISLLVRGTSNFRGERIVTQDGKYGIWLAENDGLNLINCTTRNSYRWGTFMAGNRDWRLENCGAIVTRDGSGGSGASDAIKITGKFSDEFAVYSARSSYNGVLVNPFGINTAGGQTIDIISTVDENDDLHSITIFNPVGVSNGSGLVEIKLDESGGSFTNWPLHDVTIHGGEYYGDGTEPYGVYVADRVYNITFNGTALHDVQQGFNVANPARWVVLNNVATYRTRQEGIKWESGAGAGQGCCIYNAKIVDPNYGQGASTYAGINFTSGAHVRVVNPTVGRSPVPSGSAHSYGIVIGASCSNIMIEGRPSLSGHATGAMNDAGITTRWPYSFSIEINLASGSGAVVRGIANLPQAFYATRLTLGYTQASNIDRDITVQHRSTVGSTTIGTAMTTSATAVLWQQATQAINPPQRCTASRPVLIANVAADANYPGTPTGVVVLTFEGFPDAASAAA